MDIPTNNEVYTWNNRRKGFFHIEERSDRIFFKGDLNYLDLILQASILPFLGSDHFLARLEILEYCRADELIKREQYYLDLLYPEYNILKHAYSLLGYKHTPENIAKFKLKKVSQELKNILSLVHTDKEVSKETRDKLSLATANYKKNNPLTPEALANITAKTTEREGVAVILLNTQTNEQLEFPTLTKAGEYLDVKRQAIRNAIKRESLVKGLYLVSEKK